MRIRRATAEDAPILGRIHVDAWREAYRGLVPAGFLSELDPKARGERLSEFLTRSPAETYVAESNEEVLGFLTLAACRDRDVDPAATGEIWGLYLHPSRWGQGVGRLLCGFAEQTLATRGHEVIVLWVFEANASARCFYEAMGFRPDGATKTVDVGGELPCLRYRKVLSAAAE